jgi:hypothetical protein
MIDDLATCYDPPCSVKRVHAKLTCRVVETKQLVERRHAIAAELHANWHDQIGNYVYEKCEWAQCDFWEITNLVLTQTEEGSR